MKHYALFYFAVLLTLLSSSCRHSAAETTVDTAPTSLSAPLDSLFGHMFAENDPGAIVLVAKGDSIIYSHGFGQARLDTHQAITDSTLFNICSISKQFSAIAVLKMQEQGLLNLDDTVANFFPEFKSPIFKEITLRHLLSHTSGIPDSRPRTEAEWKDYRKKHKSIYATVRDYKLYALCAESLSYLNQLDSLAFTPGTAYEYQNPTYQLILPLIEQITGERYTAWMRDNIFAPAGMVQTKFFEPNEALKNFAHGYKAAEGENIYKYFRSEDGRWEECDYGEANFFPTKADGGLYTSALEFLKWERALFDGKIVGDSSLRMAFTPVIHTDIPFTSYGLGFFIEQRPDRLKKIYHTGDNGGFYTFEGYYPDKEIFYLIFANRPDWDRDQTVEKVDSILTADGWI